MTLEEARTFFAGDAFALRLCGVTIDELLPDGARCSMRVTPEHLNAQGFVQGGAIFTLCDFTFAVAANAGDILTVSAGASITYLRPGTGARLVAEARLISRQRTTSLYRVSVTDEQGALVAYATVNGFSKNH